MRQIKLFIRTKVLNAHDKKFKMEKNDFEDKTFYKLNNFKGKYYYLFLLKIIIIFLLF